MTNEPKSVDPALWEVLLDVVGAERAPRLFAFISQSSDPLSFSSARISDQHAFLSKAERHLVRFHREELALLLRKACVLDLATDSAWSDLFVPPRPVDQRLTLPDRGDCAARAELARRSPSIDDTEAEAVELLSMAFAREDGVASDVIKMATLSHSFLPSDHARMYLALDHVRRGQWTNARDELRALVEHASTCEFAGDAWRNLGCVDWELRRFDDALMAFRCAATSEEPQVLHFLAWFALCIHMELEDEAEDAARGIDERVHAEPSMLTWFCRSRAAARVRSAVPSPGRKRLIARLEDRLGPASQRIIHALSQ